MTSQIRLSIKFSIYCIEIGLIFFVLLLSSNVCAFDHNKSKEKSIKRFDEQSLQNTEDWDRKVDQAALLSQEAAIKKLKKLIQRYTNSREEAGLLMRLADVYQESAAIEFRITYAKANRNKSEVNLKQYHTILNSEIQVLDRLIQTYPRFFAIDQALFLRAKSHEELNHKAEAKSNYLTLVKGFPTSSRTISAYMALADLAITNNQHSEAISYLDEVKKHPTNSFYPFALYKLAWSYYNLKNIPNTLLYIEKHIQYFEHLKLGPKSLSASDNAIRENSLMDAVVFYLEGNEADPKEYPLSSALKYFKKIEDGPLLGRMFLRFAKLLRSHQRDDDLIKWKDELIDKESSIPETIEVVMCLFDYKRNQNQMDQLIHISQDIIKLHRINDSKIADSESYISARKILSETADQLQAKFLNTKEVKISQPLLNTLSAIYGVFIQILPEQDPRLAQAHYNLAETLFKMSNFETATQHYLWITTHWNKSNPFQKNEVQLRAIACRYEYLRQTKWIPTDIAAKNLDDSKPEELKSKLTPAAFEWVSWIDSMSNAITHSGQKSSEELNTFIFEANRSIYVRASTRIATQRLVQFALNQTHSQFAVPSAALAIDTSIKSENWSSTFDLATQFLKLKWSDQTFTDRLRNVAEDSSYKTAEANFQAKDYLKAISQAKIVQGNFPNHPRTSDAILLMAKSYLELNQKNQAQFYFSKLIQDFPSSKGKEIALLQRAQFSEEAYDTQKAVEDYQAYFASLRSDPKDRSESEIKKRIYFLKWINEETNLVCPSVNKKSDTREDLLNDCHRYLALLILSQKAPSNLVKPQKLEEYFQLALKGPKENRAVWSAVSLKFDSNLQLQDQIYLLRNLTKGWDNLDSLVQISILPSISTLIPKAFAQARMNLRKEVPMNKASAKAITRRAEWIKEYELVASQALSLPWNRIRVAVLNELSGVYFDFSSTLAQLPTPKDISPEELHEYQKGVQQIVQPFSIKSQDLAEKAFQLASSSSVEDDVFNVSQENRLESSKKLQQKLKKSLPQITLNSKLEKLDINLIRLIQPSLDLNSKNVAIARTAFNQSSDKLPSLLKALWVDSFLNQNWTKNAFLLQELKSKKLLTLTESKMMQGLLLVGVGAKAEGLLELQAVANELESSTKLELDQILFRQYLHTFSVDTSIRLSQEIEKLNLRIVSAKAGKQSL